MTLPLRFKREPAKCFKDSKLGFGTNPSELIMPRPQTSPQKTDGKSMRPYSLVCTVLALCTFKGEVDLVLCSAKFRTLEVKPRQSTDEQRPSAFEGRGNGKHTLGPFSAFKVQYIRRSYMVSNRFCLEDTSRGSSNTKTRVCKRGVQSRSYLPKRYNHPLHKSAVM